MDSPAPTSGQPSMYPKRRRTLSNLPEDQNSAAKPDKNRTKKYRALRGILSGINEVPLEIVFEIFGYLEPLEILRLSRTSKDLRSLLMRNSSAFIWRRARQNVDGLPELPFDMSEPAYSNLAFSSLCHICLVSRCERVIWECRMRCCRRCFSSAFIKYKDMQTDPRYSALFTHQITYLVPHLSCHEWRSLHYLRTAADDLLDELKGLQGQGQITEWKSYKSVQKETIDNHAAQCELWERRMKIQRSINREKAREQRVEAVKKRLTDIGWGRELQMLDRRASSQFRYLRGVRTAQTLTDNGWAKVKPVMVQFLSDHRSARWNLERRRRYAILQECYFTYLKTQFNYSTCSVFPSFFPGLGDLVLSKDFKAIIEGTSLDQQLYPSELDPAFARASGFAMAWREEKEMELFKILCDAVPETLTGGELCRATSVFKCNDVNCGELLYYPDMFRHPCSTSCSFTPPGGSSETQSVPEPFLWIGSQPWNEGKNRIVFYDSASRIARRLLNESSYDPRATTIEDVKTWNPSLVCKTCPEVGSMSWRETLQHDESHEFSIIYAEPLVLSTVVFDPAQARTHNTLLAQKRWVFAVKCSFCDVSMRPDMLLDHLITTHGQHSMDRSYWSFDFSRTILV